MKKLLSFLLMGVVIFIIGVFFYDDDLIKYPVSWTGMMVGIEAEANYIPIDYEESYATLKSCGPKCDSINVVYEGSKEKLVVIATDYVSWADDPKWDKNTLISGTDYYYQNKNGKQLLFWEDEKEQLELGLEYTGENTLSKEELVRIAKSIKADGKQIDW